MHYILGTRFEVNIQTTGSTDSQSLMMRRYKKYFPENGIYEIWYIRPKPTGKVEYTFISNRSNQRTVVEFENAREADKIISTFTGEDLPDYDQRYKDDVMSSAD